MEFEFEGHRFVVSLKRTSFASIGNYLEVCIQSKENVTTVVRPSTEPHVCLLLDISGSMRTFMDLLQSTSFATVDQIKDLRGYLEIIAFDTSLVEVLPETHLSDESIKHDVYKRIETFLVNRNASTNLENPLIKALETSRDVQKHIMLLSDGLANHGVCTTSKELIDLARSCPGYKNSILHTLGFQPNLPNFSSFRAKSDPTEINASLLKHLALDTNGTFQITSDKEQIFAFIGDILADSTLRVAHHVKAKATFQGAPLTCITKNFDGLSLRLDKPTYFVFEIPYMIPDVSIEIRYETEYSTKTSKELHSDIRWGALLNHNFEQDAPLPSVEFSYPTTLTVANALVEGRHEDKLKQLKRIIKDSNQTNLLPILSMISVAEHYGEESDSLELSQTMFALRSPAPIRTPAVDAYRERSVLSAHRHVVTHGTARQETVVHEDSIPLRQP